MKRIHSTLLAGAIVAIATTAGGLANGQSIIKNPGDHPPYKVELEPHLVLGWGHLYRGNGFGLGARVGIVIVDNGFIKTINNSVAIGFGLDWLRYSDCYYYDHRGRFDYGCGASYFVFPATMQWNFWLSPKWSVFAEPGLYLYHGIYDDYCRDLFGNAVVGCGYPTRTGIDPALFVGGRFHFNDTVALTMRLGYPTSSIGVSFLSEEQRRTTGDTRTGASGRPVPEGHPDAKSSLNLYLQPYQGGTTTLAASASATG